MLPILFVGKDDGAIGALAGKLSLRPLLLEGLDEDGSPRVETVRGILREVQGRGDAAVLEFTEKFDKAKLAGLRVGEAEIKAAVAGSSSVFLAALDVAIANIRAYQEAMMLPEPRRMPAPGGGVGSYLGTNRTDSKQGLNTPRIPW